MIFWKSDAALRYWIFPYCLKDYYFFSREYFKSVFSTNGENINDISLTGYTNLHVYKEDRFKKLDNNIVFCKSLKLI